MFKVHKIILYNVPRVKYYISAVLKIIIMKIAEIEGPTKRNWEYNITNKR